VELWLLSAGPGWIPATRLDRPVHGGACTAHKLEKLASTPNYWNQRDDLTSSSCAQRGTEQAGGAVAFHNQGAPRADLQSAYSTKKCLKNRAFVDSTFQSVWEQQKGTLKIYNLFQKISLKCSFAYRKKYCLKSEIILAQITVNISHCFLVFKIRAFTIYGLPYLQRPLMFTPSLGVVFLVFSRFPQYFLTVPDQSE